MIAHRRPIVPKPAPRAPARPSAAPRLTLEQERQRARWAAVLCDGASDETSLRLADRVVREWTGGCGCKEMRK